jgi:hypothetical protein
MRPIIVGAAIDVIFFVTDDARLVATPTGDADKRLLRSISGYGNL